MVASLQIGTVSSYYAREYYHGGERNIAATWFSRTNQFGIVDGSAIDIKLFEQLHSGTDQNGVSILNTLGREIEGIDFCFSPGKSVSLAYGLSEDEELRAAILKAHHDAVRAALTILEQEAIFARRGKGGLFREKVRLNAALFTHDSARPEQHDDGSVFADVQIHTHAVLLNLAMRADQTVGALDTRIGRWKLCIGAAYHAHLAKSLETIGFSIREVGNNGTFEIGFDKAVRDWFSTRRERIVETLAAGEFTTGQAPAAAAAAALTTRRAKELDQEGDRFALWRRKAVGLGLDPQRSVERLFEAVLPRDLSGDELRRRLDAVPEILTEKEVTFGRQDLIRAVAVAHVGAVFPSPLALVSQAERLITHNDVQRVRSTALGEPVYSTPEMIRIEREIVELSRQLAQRAWSGLDRSAMRTATQAAQLSVDQAEAAISLAAPTALAFLEGRAGSGKTHTLRPLVDQLSSHGLRVIAAATAWRTAAMLSADLGIEARAIASWVAIEEAGGRFLDERTVLIVDEAGQLGSRVMHSLLDRTARTSSGRGCSKLILIGDRDQLQPIAAGAGLTIISRSVDSVALNTIVRQRDPDMRLAVEHLAKGDIEPAFEIFESSKCVHQDLTAKAAIDSAVEQWFSHRSSHPERDHLLLARSNAKLLTLNSVIRSRLRRQGEIGEDRVTIHASSPSGLSYPLPLARGDRVRFGMRVDRIGAGVINGTTAIIEQVEPEGLHARITAEIGAGRVVFSTAELLDKAGRVRLAHDYATTVYAAQGLTAETCTVLLDPSYDRHEFYVAASRARATTRFVIDQPGLDAIVKGERKSRGTHDEISEVERRAVLLNRLSRSRRKTTTLDEVESVLDHDHRQRVREARPDRHRGHEAVFDREL